MAERNGNEGERATVALVRAEVAEVRAIVEGQGKAADAKLDAIKWHIAGLADVPVRMSRIEERVNDLEEKDDERRHHKERVKEWKRAAIVTAFLGLIGLGVNVAIAVHWL